MNAASRFAACLRPDQFDRRVNGEHTAGIHKRDPVAAFSFVHEMGRDEYGHALIARKVDQQFPEAVARQRIDPGGRLVEDKHFGFVHDRDREREPLADPQWQIGCGLIEILSKTKAHYQVGDALLGLIPRQVKEPRVQVEVLAHGQFGIERERLRHIADAPCAPRCRAR